MQLELLAAEVFAHSGALVFGLGTLRVGYTLQVGSVTEVLLARGSGTGRRGGSDGAVDRDLQRAAPAADFAEIIPSTASSRTSMMTLARDPKQLFIELI